MVQAEQDRIVKLLEVWWETDQELEELIALIKEER
jgi:aspartyl/asparaginyl beta-hydroxylase (cupin superfamily)